jgi:hypothetical protein
MLSQIGLYFRHTLLDTSHHAHPYKLIKSAEIKTEIKRYTPVPRLAQHGCPAVVPEEHCSHMLNPAIEI